MYSVVVYHTGPLKVHTYLVRDKDYENNEPRMVDFICAKTGKVVKFQQVTVWGKVTFFPEDWIKGDNGPHGYVGCYGAVLYEEMIRRQDGPRYPKIEKVAVDAIGGYKFLH